MSNDQLNNNTENTDKEKILDTVSRIAEQYRMDGLSDQINESYKKLIDCKHEIVIVLTAHVLTQDDFGQVDGTREICKHNYHVPVPAGKDYHEYLEGFFNHLRQCISTSANHSEDILSE